MSIQKQIKTGVKVGLKSGLENVVIPTVERVLSSTYPEWEPAWKMAKGFLGVIFELQQEKINEFVVFIRDNPEKFTKQILSTQQFKDVFVITLENYFKQRSERKRRIIQRIFLGFTSTADKENFEVEKMYWILSIMNFEEFALLKSYKDNPERYKYNNFGLNSEDENQSIDKEKGIFRALANYGLVEVINYPGSVMGAGKNYLQVVELTQLGERLVEFIDFQLE